MLVGAGGGDGGWGKGVGVVYSAGGGLCEETMGQRSGLTFSVVPSACIC